jgi:hypothetical protein
MGEQRFALDWDRPSLPDASTHVSLFDGGKDPLHVVASGHGADDANALSDLLATLRERNESADAIAYVSDEYAALAGKVSARSQLMSAHRPVRIRCHGRDARVSRRSWWRAPLSSGRLRRVTFARGKRGGLPAVTHSEREVRLRQGSDG